MKRSILRIFFIFACALCLLLAGNASDKKLTAEAAGATSGTLSSGVTWQYDAASNTLSINGNGPIPDFTSGLADWTEWETHVKEVRLSDGITYIGDYAFARFFEMTKINFPSALTGIGYAAFANCQSLQSVVLPEGLTSIGECAFLFCACVESIVIPDSVTSIGDDAFMSCHSLTEVTIPFTQLSRYLFEGTAIEKLTLTGSGDMPVFVGSPTTASDYYTKAPWSYFCDTLKNLVIADGITSIGAWSFYQFTALESVTLADTVTSVGAYAFGACEALRELELGKNMQTLGNNSFYNCYALENLSMPVDTVFNDTVFTNCESLVSLTMYKGSGTMPTFERYEADCWYAKTPWYQSSDTFTTLVLEDGIKNISKYAFYGCSYLANVTLPADLAVIDAYAFSYCSFKDLVIPDTVTAINDYAFYHCSSLEALTMPVSASIYESLNTFYYCSMIKSLTLTPGTGTMPDYTETSYEYTPWNESKNQLKNITLCDGIQNIGENAFRGLSKLTSITIPDSVQTIGDYAFYGASALPEITFPAHITEIASYAFSSCRGITQLTIPETVTAIADHAFYGCSGLTDLVIGSKVETIGEHAFNKCKALKNVTIGKSVKSMGVSAFYDCTALEKVNITDVGAYCEIDFPSDKTNPAYYSQKLYLNDELITDLVIPDTVETVKANTFNTIDHIETLTVSPNTQQFDTYFFRTDIKGVYISDLAAWCTVEFNSFDLNDSPLYLNGVEIKDLVIPDGVTEIKPYTFSRGTFTSVVIPDSVQTVAEDALTHCLQLKELTIPITALSEDCAYGCKALEHITLTGGSDGKMPSGLSNYPWDDCDNLKNVTFAEGVTYVATRSFEGCELTEVVFPSTMKEIGQYAFYGSKYIRSIDFGSCELIGKNAFYNCSALQRVIFGKNLTTVQPSAFSGCPATVTYYEGTESEAGNIYFSTFNKAVDVNAHWVYNYSRTAHKFDGDVLFNKNKTMLICYPHYLTERFYAVPDTVRSIEQQAVLSDYLLAVSLPEGLKNIGSEAFLGCANLSAIYIPASLVSIDEYAFGDNERLRDIYFGGSEAQWNSIQVGYENESLKKATVHYNCAPFVTEGNAVYSGDKTALLAWLDTEATAAVIPDGVTHIGKNAFSNCKINSVTFGKDVKTVGINAFYGCKELTSVILPDSVTELGKLAFYECTKLENIRLSDNLVSIGADCFGDCTALKSIVLPAKVKSVGDRAFYDCKALESVDFPAGLQSIGTAAFYNCSSLQQVSVPASVTQLGTSVFTNCTSLTSFCLPASITRVPDDLLYGCANLEKAYIPVSVTSFGDSAFYNCSNLYDIYFDGSEDQWNAISITSSNSILYAVTVHYNHSHTYGEWIADEEQNTQSRYCMDCDTQEKTFLPGYCAHEWNEGAVTTAATCTQEGAMTFTCTLCGNTETQPIPVDKSNHAWNDGAITTPATCTQEGVMTITCTRCDDTKTQPVPADKNNHAWNDGEITSPANCSQEGTMTFTCTRCGDTKTQPTSVDGTVHVWNDGEITVPATCTTEGVLMFTCTLCGNAKSQPVPVDESKHAWNDGVITVAPTEEAEGEKTFTCTLCGDTKTETLDKLEPQVPALMYGDLDGNGDITSVDARLALRASVGLEALSAEAATAADVDCNGSVSSADARLILRYAVGLEAELPVKKQ